MSKLGVFVQGLISGRDASRDARFLDRVLDIIREHRDAMDLFIAKGYGEGNKSLLEIINELPLAPRKPD